MVAAAAVEAGFAAAGFGVWSSLPQFGGSGQSSIHTFLGLLRGVVFCLRCLRDWRPPFLLRAAAAAPPEKNTSGQYDQNEPRQRQKRMFSPVQIATSRIAAVSSIPIRSTDTLLSG